MPIDQMHVRLGKKPATHDAMVPSIHRLFADSPLPKIPDFDRRWEQVETWVLGGNDTVGDCTAVAPANLITNMTTLAGKPQVPTTAMCLAFYSATTGYNPDAPLVDGQNPTDQGGNMSDVMRFWLRQGFQDAAGADLLSGYVSVDPQDIVACKQSMNLLGGLNIGLQLPLAAQQMDVWDLPRNQPLTGDWAPGSWGGHDTATLGFEKDGTFRLITWADPKIITRRFWRAYVDEAYAMVSKDWMRASGISVEGVDWAALAGYMHAIRNLP